MGTLIQTFPDGGSGGASARMIADEFSTSVDYAVGDLVIYDKTLYKFTSAHSAGAWDPSDVTDDVTVDSELKLKQNLSDTFNGTLQQWEALPLATKLTYKYANITNDPTEQIEIVSADIDIENHVVHLDGDDLVGLNGVWKTQGEYGVKNLIPYPYVEESKTQNGVTFTINSDGSVSLSGTASAPAVLRLMRVEDNTYSGYKMSGGHSNTVYMSQRITDKSDTFIRSTQDYGDGVVLDSINPSTEKYNIMIWVANGAVTDGITIYPMLRSANDTDKTYRPYAKTNKQLTDEISGNASDIDEIDERLDNTTTAVTGNPISISGLKSNQLAKDPIITFEPIQAGSGDPSPSNVRAISGYDKIEVLSLRKNLLSPLKGVQSHDGITVTPNDDGSITLSGSNTKGENIYFYYDCNNLSNSDYIQIYTNIPTDAFAFAIGNEGAWIISERFTNAVYMIGIAIDANANFSTPVTFYPMIRLASITDPTYEPYNPLTDIQLTLGQTIYGGTLDVEKGILTVDRGIRDLGNVGGWSKGTAGSYALFYTDTGVISDMKNHSDAGTAANAVCSVMTVESMSDVNNGSVEGISIGPDSGRIRVCSASTYKDMTAEEFNTAVTGQKLCYELATPFTIQLTPHEISLLKDYAYVSTNGTNMSFSYKNGEMASLGDVESLGKTMNLLGDRCGTETIGLLPSLTNDNEYHTIQLSKAWDKFSIINIYVFCKSWGNAYISMNIPTVVYKIQTGSAITKFISDDTTSQAINVAHGTSTNELSIKLTQTGAMNNIDTAVYVTGIY